MATDAYDMGQLIADIESHALVHKLTRKSYQLKAANPNSIFLRGVYTKDGAPCFVKVYRLINRHEAVREYELGKRFQAVVEGSPTSHARTLRIAHLINEPHLVALVTDFIEGENLFELLQRGVPFTEIEAKALVRGFIELAELLEKSDVMHRDICPKNLVFDGKYLTLVDFQTASPKHDLCFKNPSYKEIRDNLSLGAGYNPHRGVWNDHYSLVQNLKEIARLLPVSIENDIARLTEMAERNPTIRPYYEVDAKWKAKMWKPYLKLLLRPLWTCKKSSREKHRYLRNTFRDLFK